MPVNETLQARVMRRYAYVGRHRPTEPDELKLHDELALQDELEQSDDLKRPDESTKADASGAGGGSTTDLPARNRGLRLRRRSGVLEEEQRDVVLELSPGDPLDERALQ